jgi:hypothetical protein
VHDSANDVVARERGDCPEVCPVRQAIEIAIAQVFAFFREHLCHHKEQPLRQFSVARNQPFCSHWDHV